MVLRFGGRFFSVQVFFKSKIGTLQVSLLTKGWRRVTKWHLCSCMARNNRREDELLNEVLQYLEDVSTGVHLARWLVLDSQAGFILTLYWRVNG